MSIGGGSSKERIFSTSGTPAIPSRWPRAIEKEGADELVFLDITASHEGRGTMIEIVRRTAEVVFMPLTVGGGIRTIEDIRALLNAGCDKVSINSAACRDPEFVRLAARRFGSQCIVVNIDPKRVWKDGREAWEVHINGGRLGTGLEAVAWARRVEELGAGEIVLTSMDADGGKTGYDLPIIRAVADAVSIPVVASGGAGCPEHMADAILLGGADAALAASIFHYGQYTIRETKQLMRAAGNPRSPGQGNREDRSWELEVRREAVEALNAYRAVIPTPNLQLPTRDPRPPISNFQLPTSSSQLLTPNF